MPFPAPVAGAATGGCGDCAGGCAGGTGGCDFQVNAGAGNGGSGGNGGCPWLLPLHDWEYQGSNNGHEKNEAMGGWSEVRKDEIRRPEVEKADDGAGKRSSYIRCGG